MKDNVDWLLHIDTDELMYPAGNDGFSLQHVLAAFADDVDTVVFPNYESLPESDKIHDPFTEVWQLAVYSVHAGQLAVYSVHAGQLAVYSVYSGYYLCPCEPLACEMSWSVATWCRDIAPHGGHQHQCCLHPFIGQTH